MWIGFSAYRAGETFFLMDMQGVWHHLLSVALGYVALVWLCTKGHKAIAGVWGEAVDGRAPAKWPPQRDADEPEGI